MTLTELTQTIARVRRAMPRNADVMAICEALEAHLKPAVEITAGLPATPAEKAPFDKKTYQRELMRKRRAQKKA